MASDRAKLAKDVLDVLVEFLPYGPIARKLVKLPVSYGIDRVYQRAGPKGVESVAEEIATVLQAFPMQYLDNPGSSISAAADVLSIVRRCNLSPDVLVECELDPTKLLALLMSQADYVIDGASAERRGFVAKGLDEFARTLIMRAPELPGVDVAFMRAVLKACHGLPREA